LTGLGIAYVAAVKAQVPKIMLCDASKSQLDKGVAFFEKLLAKDVSKGKLKQEDADAARSRLAPIEAISAFNSSSGGASAPEMVIEVRDDVKSSLLRCLLTLNPVLLQAATENLSIKQKIFGSLASELPLTTILATNTSSISVTKIAASAVPQGAAPNSQEAWDGPKRVLGLHFFNPVPVMTLVELIPAIQTSDDVKERAKAFAEACGKYVTSSSDTPGFISNRILMPYINEAVIVLESGIATKEDIDETSKRGFGHPMGALTLADFIGLDTCY
jgi:3-hydroxybutyryl-CoA dehydrogenase